MMDNRRHHLIALALCLVVATFLASPSLGRATKLPRGWKGATLDISAKVLEKAKVRHKPEETRFVVEPGSTEGESLDDTYHLKRYFKDKFDFPESIDELKNELVQCSIGPHLQCHFKQIRKVSFPGGAFSLEGEGIRRVVFWQDLASPNQSVMIVEYVLDSVKRHADLRARFEAAYGVPGQLSLGRHRLIADTLSWEDGDTFLKLCDTKSITGYINEPDAPDRYSLVFGDHARIRAAQAEMNRLLRSSIARRDQPSPASHMLVVQSFDLDGQRCSFEEKRKYGYRYYDWKWPIIEQQIFPEKYFERFKDEADKPYFDVVFAYFSKRSQQQASQCRLLLASKELVWKLPFHPKRKECPGVFPSSEELEDIGKNHQNTYDSIMHWYSQGFGVPFPIFKIAVYNPGEAEVLITHLSYELKLLDQLLPGIIDEPPLGPFEQNLDVGTDQRQTIRLNPSEDPLRIPAHQHRKFSIMLKSTKGIGHVCKVKIGIVVKRGGKEEVVLDEKLVFVTVLSSRVK